MDARPSDDTQKNSSDIPLEVEGFSEEEREEILSQIEDVATQSRMGLSNDRDQMQPRKRGSLFPIVVNILAAICIAAGVYYANRYFGLQEERLDTRAEGYLTTEGKIIDEVRKESQQRLEEKEQEISRIREDLRSIEEQQRNLEATIDQQIAEREQELQERMQQELSRERQRLEGQGLAQEDLQQQLENFRSQRQEELQTTLENFRQQSREELEQKQQELQEAQQTAERILAEAQQEKEELSRQAEEEIAELRQRFSEERQRLEEESTEVSQELERLAELRQKEQLMLDQMAAMYRDIESAIEADNQERAKGVIDDFRELLRSPGVESLPAIAKRRDVELFLLNTLESRLRSTSGGDEQEESLLNTARLVQEVRAAVEQASEAEAAGNSYDAARYYTEAIETITAVKTAHNALQEISAAGRSETARERAALAQEELQAGNREEGLQMLITAAAEAAGRTGETVRTIVDTLSSELRQRSQELQNEVAAAESRRDELEQRVASLGNENSGLEEDLQAARESRAALQEQLDQLSSEQQQLKQELAEVEQERGRLQQEYQQARAQVTQLNQDLNEAVDELAQFVSTNETDSQVRDAVQEYRRLVERSRTFSGGSSADQQAAREAFRSFMRSREVQQLFPELQSIFQRLYGGESGE